MSNLKDAKQQAALIVADAMEIRLKQLMETEAFKTLKAEIQHFEEHGSDHYHLDEEGFLRSSIDITIPEELCDGGDIELIEALLEECDSGCLYIHQSQFSRGYDQWTVEQSHGDAILYGHSAGLRDYVIFNRDLDLKLFESDIIDEEHAYLLIETAMRENGYFPHIVATDSYGQYVKHLDTGMGQLTDEEVKARLKAKVESQNGEE